MMRDGSDFGHDMPRPAPSLRESAINTLLEGVTAKKMYPGMPEEDIADMIRIASSDLRDSPIGADGVENIRMLVAAATTSRNNPDVIRGFTARTTSVDFNEIRDPGRVREIVQITSTDLASSCLGLEGTKDVRALVAAAVAGAGNQSVVDGLTGGITSARLTPETAEDDVAYIIKIASNDLESGPLGTEGTDSLRAMIAISAVAAK